MNTYWKIIRQTTSQRIGRQDQFATKQQVEKLKAG